VSYQVRVAPAPTKYLAKLRDETLKRRMVKALRALEVDARPPGCVKLQGHDELFRMRVGDYRIIYQIQDAVLIVLVVEIGHRREIYRA
jgi:mRNA interferase RelE/StbE